MPLSFLMLTLIEPSLILNFLFSSLALEGNAAGTLYSLRTIPRITDGHEVQSLPSLVVRSCKLRPK